jgi:pimeloyl-ACP methyl ester carboxylesterase
MNHRSSILIGAMIFLTGCSGEDLPLFTKTIPPTDEAAFIEIESIDYALHGDFGTRSFRSSPARLFYSFQQADDTPDEKPLIVAWNGGPGTASEILLALGTGRTSLDPSWNGNKIVGSNQARFTAFANMLYIDARGTGFSYGLLDDPSDTAARTGEFVLQNYNAWLDAADFIRVILRFLSTHHSIERAPVVFLGESYGGTRASIILHLLAHPDMYGDGSAAYEDVTLAKEIRAFLETTGAADIKTPVDPARVAGQFGTQVLVQPRLTGYQATVSGVQFEAPDSLLDDVALATGIPFVRCANQPAPCDEYLNALEYLGAVGIDYYDVKYPKGTTFARFDDIGKKIVLPDVFEAIFGVIPTQVPLLAAHSRQNAYRLATATDAISTPLDAQLGALPPWDRYYLVDVSNLVGTAFRGTDAMAHAVDIPHARWGDLFLDNLLYTRTMITAAQRDAVIYAPAIAPALAAHTNKVAMAQEEMIPELGNPRPGRIRIDYVDGQTRFIQFPHYDAGHVVTLEAPNALAADVQAFIAP